MDYSKFNKLSSNYLKFVCNCSHCAKLVDVLLASFELEEIKEKKEIESCLYPISIQDIEQCPMHEDNSEFFGTMETKTSNKDIFSNHYVSKKELDKYFGFVKDGFYGFPPNSLASTFLAGIQNAFIHTSTGNSFKHLIKDIFNTNIEETNQSKNDKKQEYLNSIIFLEKCLTNKPESEDK